MKTYIPMPPQDALLKPFEGTVRAISSDNGNEFPYHLKMTESFKCDVSFAEYYCS